MRRRAEYVRRRRAKLRAPEPPGVRLGVPNTRAAGFMEECLQQARLIRSSETRADEVDGNSWFELSDTADWT